MASLIEEKKQNCVKTLFGTSPEGEHVYEYVLSNANGMSVGILTLGGIIRYIKTPDRTGRISDVVLGYDDLQSYLNDSSYMGAIVGRYANRIAGGSFSLDENKIELDANEGGNCLHGGTKGFNQAIWLPIQETFNSSHLQLSHLSNDGDNGFPGNLLTTVSYTLTEKNQLILDITAVADKKTVVSITAHPYFNLGNDHNFGVTNHCISINTDKFLPIDLDFIPTGIIKNVAKTAFDLSTEKRLGRLLESDDDQLKRVNGFDHCYAFESNGKQLRNMATLRDDASGRTLNVSSNAPGIQFYTSNSLSSGVKGKKSIPFQKYGAACLEPQQLPNAPNESGFPSPILEAGANYHHRIVYAFDTTA